MQRLGPAFVCGFTVRNGGCESGAAGVVVSGTPNSDLLSFAVLAVQSVFAGKLRIHVDDGCWARALLPGELSASIFGPVESLGFSKSRTDLVSRNSS